MSDLLTEQSAARNPASTNDPRRRAGRVVMKLGEALHRHGAPSHRLEEAMRTCSERLGIRGRFFSLPTSIHATFGEPDDAIVVLARVEPGGEDLGRVVELDRILRELVDSTLDAAEAERRIDAVTARPPLWNRPLFVTAHGVAAATAALFFGRGGAEALVAAVLGLVAGVLALWTARQPRSEPLHAVLAAALAASLAHAAAHVWPELSAPVMTLAGIIVLVPGLGLTVAMTEIATGHLASGTARLTAAMVRFFVIGFGVAVGGRIGTGLFGTGMPDAPALAAPVWLPWLAVPFAALAFAVLLQACRRDFGWILVSGFVAYGSARLLGGTFGPEVGATVGATLVGAGSNLLARLRDRPALTTFVPGMLLLVPGSIGFRSFTAMLEHDVVRGIEGAFAMGLVAVSLVVGALLGNVLVPPRRSL